MSERPGNIGTFKTPQELLENTPTIVKTVDMLDARLESFKSIERELIENEPVKIAAFNAAMDEIGLDLLEALLSPSAPRVELLHDSAL